jgi:GNAT superfamily N-acetyltransferase
MWWRLPRGGKLWRETAGAVAKRRFRGLVRGGDALGILAYDGEEPVGWCGFGPRADFPRTERIRAFRRDDTEGVWSVNCFFIARDHRGQGIARGLLEAALGAMRKRKVRLVEGYPVTETSEGKRLAPAFSWTGPIGIFGEAGFREVQRLSPTRPLVRLEMR